MMDNPYGSLVELHLARRWEVNTAFYTAFREATDQNGLPKPGAYASGDIMIRAERVLEDGLLPELNKKGVDPADGVARVPDRTIILAAYAAAGQQCTRWWGRDVRALQVFDKMRTAPAALPSALEDRFEEIAKRPAAQPWLAQARLLLVQKLEVLGP